MARAMKDSGVEWIGEIPESWTVLKLSHLLSNISSGVSVNAGVQAAGEGEIGVLKTSCVRTGNFDVTENKSVDPAEIQKVACPVKKGAVIVSRMNTPELVGLCGYVEEDNEKIFLPDRLWQVHFNALASPIYLWLYLNSHSVRFYYASIAVGSSSSMQNISQAEFASLRVPLPPVTEQEEIVRYLTGEITAIDASIAKTQESIEEYKKLKQAVITQAVTKGIRPGRVMKDSGVEWIGDIPEEWEVSKIKYACDNLDYLRRPVDAEKRTKDGEILYDYYGASGAIDKIDKYIIDGTYILIGEDGANLILRHLPLVYVASGKYWVNNHAHILSPRCGWDFYFTAHAMESADYFPFITGSAQPKLSQGNLGNVCLPKPSLPEQQEIAAYLDEKCAAIDTLIEKKQAIITELEAYKKSLIYEYVTGKKEVPAAPEAALFK